MQFAVGVVTPMRVGLLVSISLSIAVGPTV
jgi:hypothetical protein